MRHFCGTFSVAGVVRFNPAESLNEVTAIDEDRRWHAFALDSIQ